MTEEALRCDICTSSNGRKLANGGVICDECREALGTPMILPKAAAAGEKCYLCPYPILAGEGFSLSFDGTKVHARCALRASREG